MWAAFQSPLNIREKNHYHHNINRSEPWLPATSGLSKTDRNSPSDGPDRVHYFEATEYVLFIL